MWVRVYISSGYTNMVDFLDWLGSGWGREYFLYVSSFLFFAKSTLYMSCVPLCAFSIFLMHSLTYPRKKIKQVSFGGYECAPVSNNANDTLSWNWTLDHDGHLTALSYKRFCFHFVGIKLTIYWNFKILLNLWSKCDLLVPIEIGTFFCAGLAYNYLFGTL